MRGHAHGGGSTLEPSTVPAVPPAPVPAGPQGAAGATGGSGFFFFSVAALLALTGLLIPGVLGSLRTSISVAPPQPFLCLLERPG